MSCVKVEDKGDYYRCYFENTDGEKTIEQEFEVGDLARAQTFNVKEGVNDNVTNTYYWRAVVGTGDNYIDLSKTDCDAGSTEPKAGDDIVQLGNKSDATRQAAIILSAYGNDAPYFKLYRGINSYSLDGKEFVSFSRSEVMIIADTIRFSSGETIEEYINNVTGGLVVDVETAKKAAEEAQKAAVQASEEATKAVERLDKWSADGVISPTEKQSLKDEIARIDADKTQIANGYAKYNLGTPTNYNNAHTAYRAVLVTLTASSPETITIPSDFATKQTAYYTQRTNALTAISNAARDYAETISNDLTSYKKTVTSQFVQTNNSITAAVTSTKKYTDNAISGIQIGGRNLMKLSGLVDVSNLKNISVGRGNHKVSIDTANKYQDKYSSLKIVASGAGTSETNDAYWHTWAKNLEKKEFIFSFFGKASSNDIILSLRNGNGSASIPTVTLTTSWKRYVVKLNPKTTWNDIVFWLNKAGTVWMALPKAEFSTKETDWSPAPEDSENALTEYKKEVTAQFSVLEGEISSKVSSTEMTTIKQEILNSAATDATNKVNSIQIGGRNFLKNSAFTDGTKNWVADLITMSVDSSTKRNNVNSLKLVQSQASDSGLTSIRLFQTTQIIKPSSLSFWVKADRSVSIKVRLGANPSNTKTIQANTNWQKATFENVNKDTRTVVFGALSACTWWLSEPMEVEGTKAQNWSPAQEDNDAKYATITTVESMQTEITQLSNEISLRAYKTEVTAVQNNLDKTNSNLSSLTTRVSEAEIALQPDNIWIGISSKVTTTSKVNNIVPDSCFDDANYSMLYSNSK